MSKETKSSPRESGRLHGQASAFLIWLLGLLWLLCLSTVCATGAIEKFRSMAPKRAAAQAAVARAFNTKKAKTEKTTTRGIQEDQMLASTAHNADVTRGGWRISAGGLSPVYERVSVRVEAEIGGTNYHQRRADTHATA